MRKFLNWLVFIGKCASSLGLSLEPLLPAWDELKEKNHALDKLQLEKDLLEEERKEVS